MSKTTPKPKENRSFQIQEHRRKNSIAQIVSHDQKSDPQEKSDSKDREDWAYGIHTLEEMLETSSPDIEEIMVVEQAQGKLMRLAQEATEKGYLVRYRPKTFVSRFLGTVNHQGVGIRVRHFPYTALEDILVDPQNKVLLFVVGVQDPGNLGALLRSSQAFGASGVILSERESCGVTATVRKTSAGATSHIPVARVRNVTQAMEQLRDAGWWLLGLAGEGGDEIDHFDLDRPTVFFLGSEEKGLSPTVRKHCDVLLRIPMIAGWDSLNVAASGAVALYEWQRQRRSLG